MVFQNNVLSGAGGSGTAVYQIDQSIRFPRTNNTTGGGYMSRTFGSAGDRTSWTWSCWFKLGTLNNFAAGSNLYYQFFACDNAKNDSNRGSFHIIADTSVSSNIQFQFQGHSTVFLRTNRQFRDPSAWMHLVLVWDSDNAVASERARLYINGQRETSFAASSNPTSGQEIGINLNATHRLGISYNISGGSVNYPFDGYMAEIHFLDGYSYGPEFFGETTSNNLWIPKEYTGSYGSNGFKIDGRDASDLGDDESGNGNDFTTSGLAAHDQVFDTPTNNFCVLNPISKPAYGSYMDINVTGQNLQVTENGDGVVQSYGYGTFAISSGKWYYEFYTNTYPSANAIAFGWIELDNAMTATDSGSSWKTPGMNQRHTSSSYSSWTWGLNNQTATGLSEFGQGVVIGVTTDFDNNTFTLTKNGSAYGSVDFDSVSPTYTLSGVEHLPLLFFGADGSSLATLNFGQDSTFSGALSAGGNADGNGHGNFKYTVPTGALAICSRNLGS